MNVESLLLSFFLLYLSVYMFIINCFSKRFTNELAVDIISKIFDGPKPLQGAFRNKDYLKSKFLDVCLLPLSVHLVLS